MNLSQPLYGLLVAYDRKMRLDIMTGKQKISILEGHYDYRPGPLMLCDHERIWAVMVDIVEVKYLLLNEVSQEDYEAAGFLDSKDMVNKLRLFYPDISTTSPITIIKWDNAQGYWTTPNGIELFKALY